MPAFTKGPWEVEKDALHPFFYVGKVNSKTFIATVNNEANARLIAEAPELCNLLSLAQSYMWDYYQTSTNPALKHMLMYDYNRIEELFNRIDRSEDKDHERLSETLPVLRENA